MNTLNLLGQLCVFYYDLFHNSSLFTDKFYGNSKETWVSLTVMSSTSRTTHWMSVH